MSLEDQDGAPPAPEPKRFRSIWISDTHLGTRGCKAHALDDFLRDHHAEYLYLVGDIIDGWALRKTWYWDAAHDNVVRRIFRASASGTHVLYVAGNHDEFLRSWLNHDLGGVQIVDEAEHETVDGRRLLILHGDRFDAVTRSWKWLALLGDRAYRLSLILNDWFNRIRRRLGFRYWSLSKFLKQSVKRAVTHIDSFSKALTREARERGFDGVICGHIHRAEMHDIDGILYANDGDWVESCTALVEHFDGRLELLEFPLAHETAIRGARPQPAPIDLSAPAAS